jgi:hypothetical protein
MDFHGKYPVVSKAATNKKPIEHVHNFYYLSCDVSHDHDKVLEWKNAKNETKVCAQLKRYEASPMLMYRRASV